MGEQLLQVVENKYPEIDTRNQALHQEYTYCGYNVAIFYTRSVSAFPRYITAEITNLETGEREVLQPVLIEEGRIYDEFDGDMDSSEVDIEDMNKVYKAIDRRTRFRNYVPSRLARAAMREDSLVY